MPNVLRDVIALNCVNDVLLVDPSSKGKNVIIFERAESYTGPSNTKAINLLPLILLNIIDLAEAVNLAVDESADDINKALNGAKRVVSVREDHACLFIEVSEDLIVSVALLKILVSPLVTTTDEINTSIFCSD